MSKIIHKQFVRKYCVEFLESERGFGQKREKIYYENEENALDAIERCNSSNKPGDAPDWYMIATYLGAVDVQI